MPVKTGTLQISDLLSIQNQSVLEFGMDNVREVIARDLAAHNSILRDMVAELADPTTDYQRRYGSQTNTSMVEVDEYGRGPTQKELVGATVGFPLRKFQYAIGWTAEWFQLHTPEDMARQILAAQKAHVTKVLLEVKRAIFGPANYVFQDFHETLVDLPVKRLVNADGAAIPPGPHGETFDGATHTHYLATASLDDASAKALISDVQEHHEGEVRVVIAQADEDDWRGLSSFKEYRDSRLIATEGDPQRTLDYTRTNNRPIGIVGAAEIWVKPWGLPNYAFAYVPGATKPLAFRERKQAPMRGLRVAAQLDTHPLYAEYMEAMFGLGVWTRTNGAVLETDNGTYQDPGL